MKLGTTDKNRWFAKCNVAVTNNLEVFFINIFFLSLFVLVLTFKNVSESSVGEVRKILKIFKEGI